MGSDYRLLATAVIGVFVISIAFAIMGLASPGLVPGHSSKAEVTEVAVATIVLTPKGTPTAAVTPTPAVGATTLTLVGKNILFDKSSLQAPAGQISIEFDNQDTGIPHNVHLFKGEDATGESLGLTPVTNGPDKRTLTLTLDAGTYFYHCDIHPTTMTGKLTVS